MSTLLQHAPHQRIHTTFVDEAYNSTDIFKTTQIDKHVTIRDIPLSSGVIKKGTIVDVHRNRAQDYCIINGRAFTLKLVQDYLKPLKSYKLELLRSNT